MDSYSSRTTTSSGGSDEDLEQLIDQRKRKRMLSNRESARRSRMRKQKHLDDLMTQLSQLRKENNEVMANVSITMQHYTSLEAANSVLTAQLVELSRRLESLDRIMAFMNQPVEAGCGFAEELLYGDELIDEFMNNSVSCVYANYNEQPILASSDMMQY